MNTQLQYLENTYLFNETSNIIDVNKDENGSYAVFDRTIFYPQGGGQESDQGWVTLSLTDNSTLDKRVTSVKFVNGLVYHYGNFEDLKSKELTDSEVHMNVDEETRLRNSKLHTAGHLIASIVDKMKIGLRATRGYHFFTGSYVAFEIRAGAEIDKESLISRLNEQMNIDIQKNLVVSSEQVSFEKLERMCSYIPAYLPKDKLLRIVTIQDYEPIPCGGTHINALCELESVSISKAKSRKGELRLSYSVGSN